MKTDFTVFNNGRTTLFQPNTEAARAWLQENTDPNAFWWKHHLAVESKYAQELAKDIHADGLSLEEE